MERPVTHPGTAGYTERLHVPLRWWAQGTMLVATVWLAVVVAVPGPTPWIVAALSMGVLVLCLWSYGDARVVVDDGELRVGRARIGARHLGAAESLDAEQTRRVAGPEADARAFLTLRPYLKRAVKVEITDPADPVPYWLIGTRRPDALAAALTGLHASGPAGGVEGR